MTSPASADGAPTEIPISLEQLRRCFEGAIPAVLSTVSAEGVPNICYLSRAQVIDDHHIALSNQFLSKSARNLAEVPHASLLLMDIVSHDEFRLSLDYVRTERRGPTFERMRDEVDRLAALTGMQDVFRLRAADVFRVTSVVQVPPHPDVAGTAAPPHRRPAGPLEVAELCRRLSRCRDLDVIVETAVEGMSTLLDLPHVHLMLLDESGTNLYTIASRGYPTAGVGSEIPVGEGMVGLAAEQCRAHRVGNLKQAAKYARSVRRSYEADGTTPIREIPPPGLPGADSRMVVPALALGQLVGVIVTEHPQPVAFDEVDEANVTIVAAVLANAIETIRAEERIDAREPVAAMESVDAAGRPSRSCTVRYFPLDGSVFLESDYLIKGVAGRLLWRLVRDHTSTGRVDFSNREVRLDPSLEMPGFRDNFESRLILLKRRLDEHEAPMRIEKTGRGRFRLVVDCVLRLESDDQT